MKVIMAVCDPCYGEDGTYKPARHIYTTDEGFKYHCCNKCLNHVKNAGFENREIKEFEAVREF